MKDLAIDFLKGMVIGAALAAGSVAFFVAFLKLKGCV